MISFLWHVQLCTVPEHVCTTWMKLVDRLTDLVPRLGAYSTVFNIAVCLTQFVIMAVCRQAEVGLYAV